jgi:cytochrome c oxidase subunit 1
MGLVTMFTIGGLSGVTHAVAPADTQQTDTYYIVAHFHYVLFGGALFGFVGAWYFWWPKAFGYKQLSEFHGKVNFWILLIGFNLTFGPMHILGLQGMPRRTYTYRDGYGFNFWNLVSTIGAVMIGASFLYFFWIIWSSWRRSKVEAVVLSGDPWDARGLEWMIPCPTPAHNFDVTPTVHSLDDFWHRKYGEDENGNLVRIAATEDVSQKGDATDVHLPSPSYWPIVLAFGMPFIAWGLIFNLWFCVLGAICVVGAIYGWVIEPSTDPEGDHGHPDDHPTGTDDSSAQVEVSAPEEAALVD